MNVAVLYLTSDEFDLTLHDFDEFDLTLHNCNEFDALFAEFKHSKAGGTPKSSCGRV